MFGNWATMPRFMTPQFVVNVALPTQRLSCSTANFSCNQSSHLQSSIIGMPLEPMDARLAYRCIAIRGA
jgi:hypothetical protein